MGCGCRGRTGDGKKDVAGTTASQSRLRPGRDVVGTGMRPAEAGKGLKKSTNPLSGMSLV